jgi:hypothetical protein
MYDKEKEDHLPNYPTYQAYPLDHVFLLNQILNFLEYKARIICSDLYLR